MMSSCNVASKSKSDIANNNDTLNLVSYAQNFKIYSIESGFRLIIKDGFSVDKEFYIFNDTVAIPDDFSDKQIIRTPVRSAITLKRM